MAEDERVVEQQMCRNEFKDGHGLQRNIGKKEGRGLIWCRQCAGYSAQCLRKRLRNVLRTNFGWLQQEKRPDRIHEDVNVGELVKITRHE